MSWCDAAASTRVPAIRTYFIEQRLYRRYIRTGPTPPAASSDSRLEATSSAMPLDRTSASVDGRRPPSFSSSSTDCNTAVSRTGRWTAEQAQSKTRVRAVAASPSNVVCRSSRTPYGTKVCRYSWHSAGSSLGWPFPVLKYKYIFQTKCTETILLAISSAKI